ncbi:3-methyladenine DNA glycosylase [Actinophytocola xinjiangensis]|uniref:3-methyladenine DNA glycosylase n=1 Tax=Actinophytocola xinjiangensis TaxID=485602 RepID=A0A7Z1AZ30_9PSEU|nr:3-methyladenine DNA glycosylase [Actinophytocola xinjiangensis]OLF10084.1 3-methyladenine DNA glycosylase [Actinophytocola xinjiangensis]
MRWQDRRAAHELRVRKWIEPMRERRSVGAKHPVLDFLFSYYSHRPSKLSRWHPGPGVVLDGVEGREYLRWAGYREVPGGVALGPLPENRVKTVRFVHELLTATAARAPRFGCFGLHEWAMVYQADAIRHEGWPLRLGAAETDRIVESLPVRCTHFDAFRFFTPEARPFNAIPLTRADQVDHEQPGCLHAGMDLYRWAYKLDPFTPSDLVADCFALAHDIRVLDMCASPYDLSELGYEAVRIETAAGRAEYARRQAAFTERAAPLRQALIVLCEEIQRT